MTDNEENVEYESPYDGEFSTAPAWDDRTRTIMAIVFGGLLIVLAVVFWSVIPFALTAAIIAYLLNPIADFFQRRVTFGRRGWAVLLTFILIIVIVTVVFVVLVPPLVEQSINGIISVWNALDALITEPIEVTIPFFLEEGQTSRPLIPFQPSEGFEDITSVQACIDNGETPAIGEPLSIWCYSNLLLQQQGFDDVTAWLIATSQSLRLNRETIQQFFSIGGGVTSGVLGSVFSIAGSTISAVLNGLFFLTILASLLGGGRAITDTFVDTVPDGYERDAQRLLSDLAGVWNGYVRGNFTLGVIMGFAMWLIAIVLGLPNPLFLAFVAFAMEFIPNLGPVIAMFVAGVIAIAGGSSTFPEMNHLLVCGIVVLAWFVMQQLEATVLVPRIVGENLKLHPAIVILSVLWGGSFGGIVGVIIAPPLVASARIILHYIYGRLTGRTAFSEREAPPESIFSRGMRLIGWLQRQAQERQQKHKKTSA